MAERFHGSIGNTGPVKQIENYPNQCRQVLACAEFTQRSIRAQSSWTSNK